MPLERPIEISRTATRSNKLQNSHANNDFLARINYEAPPATAADFTLKEPVL
jgi:hypothetical protein